MKSTIGLARLSAAAVLGLICAASSLAATEIHERRGSTTITTQSGGGRSTTKVIRTPDGQKVITRDGSNTDISIQRDGSRSGRAAGSARPDMDRRFGGDARGERSRCRSCGSEGDAKQSGTSWWRRWLGRDEAESDADPGDCDRCPPTRERSSRADDEAPSASEFKERMRERMRPVFPRP